jgi:TolA-binding protein
MSNTHTKTPLLNNNSRNAQQQDEQIRKVQGQISDTQTVMQQNIHHAIQRGQNLDEINDKSIMLEMNPSASRIAQAKSERICALTVIAKWPLLF